MRLDNTSPAPFSLEYIRSTSSLLISPVLGDTARSSVPEHHVVVQVQPLLHDPRSLNGDS